MIPPSPPPAAPFGGDPLIGREVGPYRVEERLGEGGMGVVYRAVDTRLQRAVALKFLSPRLGADARARDRLLQEARAVAALDHPHVASVYDVGETDDGRLYVAMAYYEGETLRQHIEAGTLGADEAVRLATQIARGLGAAHRAGIVHRDVKPANVIVLPQGGPDGESCAKVLDFGIAKMTDANLTQTGESLGTSLYMAPEQLRGEGSDARTDIWGLGVVLYEMLAGRRPFTGPYAAAVGYAVLHEEPGPISRDDLPAGLAEVVSRCLEKDPSARYASMDALAADLDAVANGTWGDSKAEPVAEPASAPRRTGLGRGPGLRRALAALGVVAVLVVAWVALRPVVTPEAAEAAPQRRLVVLPFSASGPDAEALADGLVEVVTGKLGQLIPREDSVVIVPASEVEAGMSAADARDRFGATLAIGGIVSAETDTVSVVVSLTDLSGETPDQVDSREVGGEGGQTLALQDAIALQVAELLRVQVADDTRERLAAGGTDDPEANAAYLRGRGRLRNQQSVADLEEARGFFEEAISRDSEFALAHAGLAEAEWQTYRRTDDVAWAERAVASAERALALDPELPEVYVALAVTYQGLGQYADAASALNRALELDPSNSEAFRRLAKVYADQGDANRAETAFREAIRLAPEFWRTYNSLGVFFLSQGEEERAAEQFRLGLVRDPLNLSLHLNLGVASWQGGDLEEAEEAFSDVLRLDPEHEGALANLSVVRLYLGDLAGAEDAARRTVALSPDDYEAHAKLAEARWWGSSRADAEADLAAVLRLARENLAVARTPRVLMTMGRSFALLSQRDSALTYLAEVERTLTPETADVQDAYVMGTTYEIAGDRRRALRWLQSAIQNGFGAEQAARSPWLSDLRQDPLFASISPP